MPTSTTGNAASAMPWRPRKRTSTNSRRRPMRNSITRMRAAMSRRRALACAGVLAGALASWPAAPAGAKPGAPREIVEQTVEKVLAVLQQGLPKEERRARLEEIVYDRFDFW